MSVPIRLLTSVVLVLPLGFLYMARQEPAMLGIGLSIALVYLGVWLFFRPKGFAVSDAGLALRWPLRSDLVPYAKLRQVEVIDYAELRRRMGFAVRVGAGGLWGVFGYLKTTRGGWVRTYISRADGLLLITLSEGAPLLISPEDPEGFAAALEARRIS